MTSKKEKAVQRTAFFITQIYIPIL